MKTIFFMLAVVTTIAACNSTNNNNSGNSEDTIAASKDTGEMHIQVPNMTCYQTTQGKDSVFLKLEKFPNVVTGHLTYKLYEKDSNDGDIDGTLHGDTLIADYSFMSEGVKSVRQVAYLINGSTATEGYADMEEKDGKMVFKDMNKLDFSKGIKLEEAACPEQ